MKKMIMDFLEEKGLYSPRLREQIANNALIIVGHRDIDVNIFCNWLSRLSVEGVINIGSYFLTCFEKEIRLGHFDKRRSTSEEPTSTIISHSSAQRSIEEFEYDWEEWKELLSHFYSDDSDDCVPAKGVLFADSNTNKVRALSDGNGGLIYIDGSISKKYPRFEDLNDDEKRDLYDAVVTDRDASYLSHFEYLLEKIRPYETAR